MLIPPSAGTVFPVSLSVVKERPSFYGRPGGGREDEDRCVFLGVD